MRDKSIAFAARSVTFVCISVLTWLFFRFALPAVLPIVISLILSSATRPVTRTISKKSRASEKVCGAVLISLIVFAALYGGGVLLVKLFREFSEFLENAVSDLESEDNVIRTTLDFFKSLPDRLPFLSKLQSVTSTTVYDKFYELLIYAAREAASKFSVTAAALATGFIKGLPRFIFSVIVCIIALFYLTVDCGGIRQSLKKLLPESLHEKSTTLFECFSGALGGYIKAYLTLMTLTFSELFLAFVILRIKYAFLLAVLISLIDIRPVLGVGTVLVPWACVLLLSSDTARGVGLLIVFVIMYLVRQWTEPRLVGRFMGIHPMLTLCASYAGYCLFGLWGIITAPIALYLTKLFANESKL